MQQIFSPSSLGSFENCPKKFHYRYIEKIEVETESIEAFVGKRVHEVLERLYQFVGDDQLPGLPKVLRRFGALWEEQYDPERVLIVRKGMKPEFYRQLGERCLENYYRRHYPFDADETLGIEEHVQFALDEEGAYRIRGIVDRIARARDGVLEIHDYKTGKRVPRQSDLDGDRQLALYQMGIAKRYGSTSEFRLVWHYVASDQTRFSQRSTDQLASLRQDTMELIDQIRAEEVFPTRVGPLCGWCEYKDRCPAMADTRAPATPKKTDVPKETQGRLFAGR